MTDYSVTNRRSAPPGALASGGLRQAIKIGQFLVPILGMIVVWELVVRVGIADADILPAPSAIMTRAVELLSAQYDRVLVAHIGHSLLRALMAFALAVAIAVPVGFWLGLNRTAYEWVSPVLSVLLPLPAVAWTPIFLVALGQGDTTITWVCFLGAVFPVLYSTIQGVQAIGNHTVWVVRSMGASRAEIFFKVLVPASLPTLMAGFKLGMAHSWRTLVAAEMLAALDYGLGYMIFAAREYMDVQTMFVGIVTLAAFGLFIEQALFGTLEHFTVRRWYRANRVGGDK